jgi:hypothetical protein
VNKSKTVPVGVSRLYRAFSVKRTRQRWLPGVDLKIRTSRVDESMRITWTDGTDVDVRFVAKGPAKSQVVVQHRKLPGRKDLDRMKSFWAERLAALAERF